jgi:hypothetical protein
MNNDLEKDIQVIQSDVLASLQKTDSFAVARPAGCVKGLIQSISTFNPIVVELLLGDAGTRFLEFARAVDQSHPHLFDYPDNTSTVFEGVFNYNSELTRKVFELLELFEYAHAHNLLEAMSMLSKITGRELGSFFRDVNAPEKNQQYVHLLKTREERDAVRKNKKILTLDLNSLARKGEGSWSSLPKSFGLYARNSSTVRAEMEKAEKMAQKYREMRCNSLYLEVKKSIDIFVDQLRENYYGFHRIKMADAALILAKVHGFEFVEKQVGLTSRMTSSHITVPQRFFGEYRFSTDDRLTAYRYAARVYPAYELADEFKSDASSIIDKLEAFPECAGKAIFDHYMVVVPSIHCNFNSEVDRLGSKEYYFFDKEGKRISAFTIDDIQKKFDVSLIKSGYTIPVLLAEKDGKCHFLSYWTYQGEKS